MSILTSESVAAPINPCCQKWEKKYSLSKESRGALRKAVNVLQRAVEEAQAENIRIKTALEEERVRALSENASKEKESAARVSLESQLSALRSEISLLQQKGDQEAPTENDNFKVLHEKEKEIKELKELLEKEKKNVEAVKKEGEEIEKYAEAEKLKNEEIKLLQTRFSDKDEEVNVLQVRVSEREKEINTLKDLLEKEKKKETVVKKGGAVAKKFAEAEKIKNAEIKSLQTCVSDKIEEVKVLQTCVSEREKEINELRELLEKERKIFAAVNKGGAEAEKFGEAEKLKNEEIKLLQSHVSDKDAEVKVLQAHMSEREKVINELKELLEKEKENVATVKKGGADAEKFAEAEKLKNEEIKVLQTSISDKNEELKALQVRISEREKEIDELKKLYEKEKKHGVAKKKGAAELKKSMEAEYAMNEETNRLQTRVYNAEKEITRLKDLVEKEKSRAELEKKKADSEKKRAIEAWKYVKTEKGKADEERRLAQVEAKKAEDYRSQLEELRNGLNETKLQLGSVTRKFEEVSKKLVAEKQKLSKERKERKRVDSERMKADAQMKLVEGNTKKSEEEKSRADSLNQQLEVANQRIIELQKEMVKQKSFTKKKKSELDILKVEEQRQKAVQEKSRADSLSQQLQEERIRTVDLQKQVYELLNSKKVGEASAISSHEEVNAESANIRMLKKELKFERKRLKHANQVAKLEKTRNDALKEELGHLKLEFFQFSRRLNQVDRCFGPETEKDEECRKMQELKLKEKLCSKQPSQIHLQSEKLLLYPSYKAVSVSDPNRQAIELSALLNPRSGGNCCEFDSGIDSRLESPGGVINSSAASFSEGRLVCSKEKDRLSPKKVSKENLNPQLIISSVQEKFTQALKPENLAVVAVNSGRTPPHTGVIDTCRKRKRLHEVVESISNMYSENKSLNLRIEKQLASLQGVLDGSPAKLDVVYKKRKTSHEKKENKQRLCTCDGSEKTEKLGKLKPFEEASQGVDNHVGTAQTSRKGNCDSDTHEHEGRESFIEGVEGDYMKLLELDNKPDEECYRKAMEMPLSPSLPEINFEENETSDQLNFETSLQKNMNESLPNEEQNHMPDNAEIDSNSLNCSKISSKPSLHKDEGAIIPIDVINNTECGTSDPVQCEKAHTSHALKFAVDAEIPVMPCSGDALEIPTECELGLAKLGAYLSTTDSRPLYQPQDQVLFPPSSKCQFSDGTTSLEAAMLWLLKTLQKYAQSGIFPEDWINMPSFNLLSCLDKTRSSLRHEDVYDMNCEVSCCLQKYGPQAIQSKTSSCGSLCHLGHILSLLDLLAGCMDWDWITLNIVYPLLKLLEMPLLLEFYVAIVIFLGQLVRLGVDAGGHQGKGVDELRLKLSEFLLRETIIRAGLPIQISTVSVLLKLIPANFEDVIKGKVTFPASSSLSTSANFIRKWYSLLSNDQQLFSLSLLQSLLV